MPSVVSLPFSKMSARFFRAAALLIAGTILLFAITSFAGPADQSEPSVPGLRDSAPRVAEVALVTEKARSASLSSLWKAEVSDYVAAHFNDLESIYKHLHSNPELSYQELQTAAYLSKQLAGTDFEITRRFGGSGFVAVLRNGDGPTVLVRTEMDALPVEEKTGLAFASKVQSRDRNGNLVGVMHACGHDVHMTCWIGAARALASMRDRWHGTLVFVAQPAEETGAGAYGMLEAGLYTKFPRPDYCLAMHCDAQAAAGTVAYTPGLAMANIDMVEVVVRGKGGHGAWPQMTVDPVVLSARLILDFQTLVSRENDPNDPLVLTIGTIHGGVKPNIIPNEVTLQLTVRTTRERTRKHVLDGIARMAKAAAIGAKAPEPTIKISSGWHTPAVVNDPQLLENTLEVLRETLGESRVCQRPPMMGGEDFALYGKSGIPSLLFFLGTQSAEKLAQAENNDENQLPSLHSDCFAPVTEPTLKTGTLSMTLAVLNLVGKTTDPTSATAVTSSRTVGKTLGVALKSKVR